MHGNVAVVAKRVIRQTDTRRSSNRNVTVGEEALSDPPSPPLPLLAVDVDERRRGGAVQYVASQCTEHVNYSVPLPTCGDMSCRGGRMCPFTPPLLHWFAPCQRGRLCRQVSIYIKL